MNAGFKAGTIMCILQGPWQVADILTGEAFTDPTNLVIAKVPDGVNGKTGSPVGGHNWVVSLDVGENADKAAAVASFLTYMTDAAQQAVLAKSLGLLPTNTAAYAVPDVASDPLINQWNAVLAAATNRSGVPGASGDLRLVHQELPEHDHRRPDPSGRTRRDRKHVGDGRVQEPDGADRVPSGVITGDRRLRPAVTASGRPETSEGG